MKVTKEEVVKIIREAVLSIEKLNEEGFVDNGFICKKKIYKEGMLYHYKIYSNICKNAEILKGIFAIKNYCIKIPNDDNCLMFMLRLLASLGMDVSNYLDLTENGYTYRSYIWNRPALSRYNCFGVIPYSEDNSIVIMEESLVRKCDYTILDFDELTEFDLEAQLYIKEL